MNKEECLNNLVTTLKILHNLPESPNINRAVDYLMLVIEELTIGAIII